MRKPTTRSTLALLALSLALLTPSAHAQQDVHAPLVPPANRKPAPAFHLLDETGKTKQPSSYRGKIVLLNFWATTCGGCILEIPSFIDIEKAYQGKPFTAVGIAMDISYDDLKTPDEAWAKVRPFVAKHHLNYPIIMGDTTIASTYKLEAYPATYLLDKSGRIAATYVGVVSKADIESNLNKLLLEK